MKVIAIIFIILIMLGCAGLLNNIVEQLKQANEILTRLMNSKEYKSDGRDK